jgi:D-alanyl-D-alanine carboxypeptidase/D-alanyl-D-alanine-endopeptidase (penicillin-binding protein 4)
VSAAGSADIVRVSEGRRLPRLAVPIALVIVAVTAAAFAVQAEKAGSAPRAIGARSPVTPVLSARRVPDIIAAPVADRRLVAKLIDLASRTPGASCLTVHAGGREVFASNPTLPLSPASVEKLVTAQAALELLGPDTTLHTSVRASGAVNGGVVEGNLALVGGGDPLLMTDAYAQSFRHVPTERTSVESLADRIVTAGVREVRGSVVGDDSRYDNVHYLSVWPSRFVTAADIGPMTALLVDDGFEVFPPSPDLRLPKTTAAADPAALAASRLQAALVARGVTVAAPAASGRAPDGAKEIASIDSAPIKAIVAEMLRESDNEAAELLTKEIGLQKGGAGTTEAGIAAITELLRASGLPVDGTTQVDGSGLATQDQKTCALIQAILDKETPSSPIVSGLPVAGQTGTLEKRFLDNPAAGRLRAKTGSLNQVTALAGFIDTIPGATLSFTYVINLTAPTKVTTDDVNLEEQLGSILVTYPEGPDLAALGPVPP